METYFPGVNYESVTNQGNNALLLHILQSIGSSSVKSTHWFHDIWNQYNRTFRGKTWTYRGQTIFLRQRDVLQRIVMFCRNNKKIFVSWGKAIKVKRCNKRKWIWVYNEEQRVDYNWYLERSIPSLFYSNEILHIYECVINLGNLTANLNLQLVLFVPILYHEGIRVLSEL